MRFTFEEWRSIRHYIEMAVHTSEAQMRACKASDKEYSCYQIFKRQVAEATRLLEKLDNMEI